MLQERHLRCAIVVIVAIAVRAGIATEDAIPLRAIPVVRRGSSRAAVLLTRKRHQCHRLLVPLRAYAEWVPVPGAAVVVVVARLTVGSTTGGGVATGGAAAAAAARARSF